jgi:hypothetical protein
MTAEVVSDGTECINWGKNSAVSSKNCTSQLIIKSLIIYCITFY